MKSYLHFQEFGGGLPCLCGLEVFESIHASKGWTRSKSHVSPINSCAQNEEPLPLGQASVGLLTCILLIRSEIYRMIYNELY